MMAVPGNGFPKHSVAQRVIRCRGECQKRYSTGLSSPTGGSRAGSFRRKLSGPARKMTSKCPSMTATQITAEASWRHYTNDPAKPAAKRCSRRHGWRMLSAEFARAPGP